MDLSVTLTPFDASGGTLLPPQPAVYRLTGTPLYSRVWHQNNREKTSVPVRYMVQNVLYLPKESYLGRQLSFCLVFLLSGFLHSTIDLSAGISWHESGAMRFFCTQALGIWTEELVRALCVGLYDGVRPLPRWTVLLGYIWVVLFLSWSWPAYMYPMLYRTREGSAGSFLPFSVVGRLLSSGQAEY